MFVSWISYLLPSPPPPPPQPTLFAFSTQDLLRTVQCMVRENGLFIYLHQKLELQVCTVHNEWTLTEMKDPEATLSPFKTIPWLTKIVRISQQGESSAME